jgi:hypothetical protein
MVSPAVPRRPPRRLEPPQQVLDVRAARGLLRLLAAEPLARHRAHDRLDQGRRDERREPRVGLGDRPRVGEEDVLADERERAVGHRRQVVRSVLEVERRPVVDEPQPTVPPQQVRVARGPIDVRHQRVEPHDRGRERRVGRVAGAGHERQRRGQEVEADVAPAARGDQLLDLGVGLGAAELRVELDQHDLGHVEPERAPELAGDELGHERARALAGAAELQDVQAVVVGLDEPRHRPALAQRRHVAGRGHRPRRGRRGRAVAHGGDLSEPLGGAGIVAP